jgi:hypothetical protein
MQNKYANMLNLQNFALGLLISILFLGCGDKSQVDIRYIYDQTKAYFYFQEGSEWTYQSEDSTETETYKVENLVDFIHKENQSQNLTYDMVRDANYKMTLRIETGPIDYADRVAYLVYDGNEKMTIGALVYSKNEGFYVKVNESVPVADTMSVGNRVHEGVITIIDTNYPEFSEVVIAKNFGIVSFTRNGGKKFNLIQEDLIK